jgi:hypothetical protein
MMLLTVLYMAALCVLAGSWVFYPVVRPSWFYCVGMCSWRLCHGLPHTQREYCAITSLQMYKIFSWSQADVLSHCTPISFLSIWRMQKIWSGVEYYVKRNIDILPTIVCTYGVNLERRISYRNDNDIPRYLLPSVLWPFLK